MSEPVSSKDVARGAGLAALSRLGALVEAVAQPLYIWLFGLATYGIYVVLWGLINLAMVVSDLAMGHALQRIVPAQGEEAAHASVRRALLTTLLPAVLIALAISLNAERLAPLFAVAPEDRATLPTGIALFAWALPLLVFLEVATSAVRARRAFGPEIRVRILWEQLARIGFAVLFFGLGLQSTGLIAAHVCSLALAAGLCLPLLRRYYRPALLLHASGPRGSWPQLVLTGVALMPSNLARRMLVDAPTAALNFMLAGAAGAAAAGLFEVARKISTIPHIVRQSFQYVLAPLASAQAQQDRAQLGPLYHFAARLSAVLVIPLAGFLIFSGADILSIYRPEAMAALPLLVVLASARALEAVVGPAATVVEMTGHRALPLLNSVLAIAAWAVLAALLVPAYGPMGMAIAVAAATVLAAYAAALELRITEGLQPFDRPLVRGMLLALLGVAAMAGAEAVASGPVRFAAVLSLWAGSTWAALRFGLPVEDRRALGKMGRKLRLV